MYEQLIYFDGTDKFAPELLMSVFSLSKEKYKGHPASDEWYLVVREVCSDMSQKWYSLRGNLIPVVPYISATRRDKVDH